MKKTLSIILAILMIVTTIPMAFAAEETPDFTDAKGLTSVDNLLYIEGEAGATAVLPAGKYKLSGNISTDYSRVDTEGEVVINLNGYTWNLNNGHICERGSLSVYDTSTDKTGKITSNSVYTIFRGNESQGFYLYGGTIENTSSDTECYAIYTRDAATNTNLYGGKVISSGYDVYFGNAFNVDTTLVLGDVVLESGEGYAQIYHRLDSQRVQKISFIDVTDYTGESLEVYSEISINGKVKILEGVKSAKEAEKYKINVKPMFVDSNIFLEKMEYDEATGCINAFIARDAFTQKPSVDNNLTVDFNNPAATFQWYEAEEKNIGVYTVNDEGKPLFTYDFKAGDILNVSTDSEMEYVNLKVGNDYLLIYNGINTGTIKFDTDETITVSSLLLGAENPIELEFSVITKEKVLDGETGKTLQNPECNKNYWCKVAVDKYAYTSDTVVRTHIITQVDAKAPTCTEIGWNAYEYCTACDYTTYVEIPATGEHIDADGDTMCDIGGEQLICEDCRRPVHEGTINQFICIILTFIRLIVSFFKSV